MSKKKLFQVYGTMFSFVTTTVEAESIEEANEIAYGAGGWMEEGADFELSKDMTEELTEEGGD